MGSSRDRRMTRPTRLTTTSQPGLKTALNFSYKLRNNYRNVTSEANIVSAFNGTFLFTAYRGAWGTMCHGAQ